MTRLAACAPWWLGPNGNCQNDLETGDVIEGLPNATFPVTLNGNTYHPQNEALLQWFAGVSKSNAIHHAFSYPDTTVLPTLTCRRTQVVRRNKDHKQLREAGRYASEWSLVLALFFCVRFPVRDKPTYGACDIRRRWKSPTS